MGDYTTGTLTVPLDPFDHHSPSLELPVVIRFAEEQPAPKGLLLTHCGGPGSTSSCVYYTYGRHMEGYDVFGITQRGMGSAEPKLSCDNSKLPEKCGPLGCQACGA